MKAELGASETVGVVEGAEGNGVVQVTVLECRGASPCECTAALRERFLADEWFCAVAPICFARFDAIVL